MDLFIILLIGGGLLAGAMMYTNAKKKELVNKGEAVDRDNSFFRKKNVFTTTIEDFEKIANAIDQSVLASHKISFEPQIDKKVIVFHNKIDWGTFGAALRSQGKDETTGKYIYTFQVETWKERNGITRQDLLGANVLLTGIEKAFYSLDANTSVERAKGNYNSKASLF